MNEFVLHPEAFNDLDEIWENIAAENLHAADRVLDEIYDAIASLVRFPHQGHTRPDLTSRSPAFPSGPGLRDRLRAGRKATRWDRDSARPAQSSSARCNTRRKALMLPRSQDL